MRFGQQTLIASWGLVNPSPQHAGAQTPVSPGGRYPHSHSTIRQVCNEDDLPFLLELSGTEDLEQDEVINVYKAFSLEPVP